MKKRLFAFISVILVFCSILLIPAIAVEIDVPADPVEPDDPYVDISYYNVTIDINSSGRAYCSSYAQTRNTTYKVYISISLMRYKDGYWQHYAGPWSNSGTGYCTSYKYYYVVPGYYYCTASSVTVRTASGDYVESATIYSPYYYY